MTDSGSNKYYLKFLLVSFGEVVGNQQLSCYFLFQVSLDRRENQGRQVEMEIQEVMVPREVVGRKEQQGPKVHLAQQV